MLRSLRSRISSAHVIAIVALFVSLSGTATAVKLITGRQIADNTVTSADVKNRSLAKKDFSAGAISALTGQPGAPGATGPQGAAGPQGPKGDPGANGADGAAGDDAFADVGVATYPFSGSTSSTTFVDIPPMTTTVTVPAGKTATVVANFSAEAKCTGGASGGTTDDCLVRVLLDDVEMNPANGTDSVFKSWGGFSDDHHALVRSRSGVGPGTHTVKVQWATRTTSSSTPMTFTLDDFSLTALAIEN